MTSESKFEKATVLMLIAAFVVFAFNTAQISTLAAQKQNTQQNIITGQVTGQAASQASSNPVSSASVDIIPKGVPEIYGQELSVSFSDVSPDNPTKADATIRKLGMLDQQIKLQGADMDRYIKIASQISCEYCCGAPAIIDKNGQAACGCAHSYAMRGLAKYLITQHGDEYTDDQILEEMGKWKTLFFPTQLTQKAEVLKGKGIELNYINLASNKYRGAEQGASGAGGMVGGC